MSVLRSARRRFPVTRNVQYDYSKPYGIRPYTWITTPKAIPTQIVLIDRSTGVEWFPAFDETVPTLDLLDQPPWNFFEIPAAPLARPALGIFIEDDAEIFARDSRVFYELIFWAERKDRPFLVPSQQDRDKLFRVQTTGNQPDLPLRVSEYVVSV